MKKISKLGIGPMSSEIIEAVFKYSKEKKEPLMLISSKNQIDWDGGYVNNWNTRQYMTYIKKMEDKYRGAKVYMCRDHCGPGFKKSKLKDTYKTIENDIENGFDLIHIDFSKLKKDYDKILDESKKAIKYIQKKSPETLIEVGTDENTGLLSKNYYNRVKKEMEFFTNFSNIHFFVCQTGSLVKEINQVGKFNKEFIKKIKCLAKKHNLYLKEHNLDYVSKERIKSRKGLIDAVNVAPQLGVIQTNLTITKALLYGIDFSNFLNDSYKSKKWEKWLFKEKSCNKLLCSLIAGHYIFNNKSYKDLYGKINKHEDFRETIIKEIMNNIDLYIKNL
ncbi:MAG: hypothetical protein GF387_03250 [Candidatus Portnoybacteria bacterium]|nr:hypothetical protein [Candidatus Portnoybacteria bacterium]